MDKKQGWVEEIFIIVLVFAASLVVGVVVILAGGSFFTSILSMFVASLIFVFIWEKLESCSERRVNKPI